MLREYVVVDLEMTGLKPSRDKILEIGAVRVKDAVVVAEYSTLVNPQTEIAPEIVELTGITKKMAETGKDTKGAVAEFLEFAGALPLVGHNIRYDYGFLKHNAANHNLKLESAVLDTLIIARKVLPELEKKTLPALCEHFNIVPKKQHRALDDAKATARLFEILQNEFQGEYPQLFVPYDLNYKVKKQGPITPRQKKYLKELAIYHKIELPVLDGLTKNQASRLVDELIRKYGKMPKNQAGLKQQE